MSSTESLDPFVKDVEQYSEALHTDSSLPALVSTRHAGFIQGVQLFDARFFQLPLVEVTAMDPHQRHLLEWSYGTLHSAGHSREELLDSPMGVFVGVAAGDFQEMAGPTSNQLEQRPTLHPFWTSPRSKMVSAFQQIGRQLGDEK